MPIAAPITFVAGALPQGIQYTPQELFNAFAALLQGFYDDNAAGFQNGGLQPTSNVGPWLQDGRYWRFWNPDTGSYSLGIFNPGWIMPTGEVAIDELAGLYYLCDGRQVTVAGDQGLFNAIGYNFNLPSDMSGSNPINPSLFRIPGLQGRTIIGAGTGSGLTLRTLGEKGGEESHLQTIAEMPAHTHTEEGVIVGTGTGGPVFVPVAVQNQQNTGSTGGGDPMPIMNPFQVANFLIFR